MNWFFYILIGVVSIGFVAPFLISAPDTMSVLLGVVVLLVFAWVSWIFCVKKIVKVTVKVIKDFINDEF